MKTDRKHSLSILISQTLPLLVSIIILGVLSIVIFSSYIFSSTKKTAASTLKQAITYYDTILDEMDAVSVMIASNPELTFKLKTIQDSEQMNYNSFVETKLIKSFLASSANSRPAIDNIYLFIDNKNEYVLQSDKGFEKAESLPQKEWLDWYMEDKVSNNLSSYPLIITRDDITFQCIRLARPLMDINNNKNGVLIIDLKSSILEEYFSIFSQNNMGYLEVTNTDGYHLFSSGTPTKSTAISFEESSSKYGWNFKLSFPLSIAFTPTIPIIVLIILSLIAITTVGSLVTYRANEKERKFIENLANRLLEAGAETIPEKRGENIFETLNTMIIDHFIEHDYQKVKSEAVEYRALQLQINPHFLFNTLDTIYWKAIKLTGGENDLALMIKQLSDLMKHSLRFDNLKGIPLKEELEATRKYISIQHYRFRDNFQFMEDMDPSLLDTPVPSLIFQPLLENAFNHGFIDGQVLHIKISGKRTEDTIVFQITNDGNPIPIELIEKIRKGDFKSLKKSSSLGLSNTVERLQLFYHHRVGVELLNEERLVKVIITIPYNTIQ